MKRFAGVLLVVLFLATFIGPTATALGTTELITKTTAGDPFVYGGTNPAISADGRFVAFESAGPLPGANDGNGVKKIYLRDRQSGLTELIARTVNGDPFYNGSTNPAISADGRFVAFDSHGPVEGENDGCGCEKVYIRDRQANTTELITITSFGNPFEYGGTNPAISADGRFVAFESAGPLPGTNDGSGGNKIYLRDRQLETTELVSIDVSGDPFASGGTNPSVSANGRFIGFVSDSAPGGGRNTYLRDRQTATTELINTTTAGDPFYYGGTKTTSPSEPSNELRPAISADGRFVAFQSHGPIPGANDGCGCNKIYLRDRQLSTTELITKTTDNEPFENGGSSPEISSDGRFVAFESGPGIYLRDRQDATTEFLTVTTNGDPFEYGGENPSISANARFVAFESAGPLPGTNDGCGCEKVYLRDRQPDDIAPTISNVSWSANPLEQGQTTTLSASVTDALSGIASVQYSIDGGSPQAMTYNSSTGRWEATFGSSLLPNTYMVTITATDFAGNTSSGTDDILAVYNVTNGYVTGHAKTLPTPSDVLPIALDTSANPANLILGFTNVTSPASGSFDLTYKVKNNQDEFNISSTSISWVVVADSTHASILGYGDLTTWVNGAMTLTQNVAVRFDITLGTNGNPDTIQVKIYNPGDNPNAAAPAYTINDTVIANGSNLMVHP